VPHLGAIYVQATPPDGLEIEMNGRRVNWGQALSAYQRGLDKGRIEAPAP
jgi:hypothetical protein